MSNLVLNATRVLRHSRRYFLVLCGWCDTELGPVGGALRPCGCDVVAELRDAAVRWALQPTPLDPDQVALQRPRRRALRGRGAPRASLATSQG